MEVRDNEIGIMQVDVQRRVTQEDTGNTARNEERYHANSEQHRRREADITPPYSSDPVECFYRRWHRDDQRGDHEHTAQERVHARNDHVVAPYDERQRGNTDERIILRVISKDRFARVYRDNFRRYTHRRHNYDIYFRVTEEPE